MTDPLTLARLRRELVGTVAAAVRGRWAQYGPEELELLVRGATVRPPFWHLEPVELLELRAEVVEHLRADELRRRPRYHRRRRYLR